MEICYYDRQYILAGRRSRQFVRHTHFTLTVDLNSKRAPVGDKTETLSLAQKFKSSMSDLLCVVSLT